MTSINVGYEILQMKNAVFNVENCSTLAPISIWCKKLEAFSRTKKKIE